MPGTKKETKKEITETKDKVEKKMSKKKTNTKKPRRVVKKPKTTKKAKKPLSAYILFTQAKREEIAATLKDGEKINAKLGEVWRAMSKEEKQPFFDSYKKSKEEMEVAAQAKKESASRGLKAARAAAKAKKEAEVKTD
ncbi:hypothetical protein, conserved [Entamoeba dispar SAW760]|uniref:HMG box domain-containing protein n=1 Tax=Entamoeba dispar (strain ATCC PRA-260 / SAW760) TaxID=370354 RepID=B0E982_ENTDS|nr:uncharacterized protein EDI_249310 [Entamoeba dispar SAW760]EDR28911.1 hypothetical protein, conserved [Entamoeba dispar SAW760]|eukprot:EDR28911.1 hypothetical protein, conserved [Entamoeba dispar SAW760]